MPELAKRSPRRDGYEDDHVAGGDLREIQPVRQVLPQYITHLDRDFGIQLWEKMMEDPACRSAVGMRRAAGLADGIRVQASVTKPKPWETDQALVANAERAAYWASFVERAFGALERSGQTIEDVARDLYAGKVYGNRIGEITLDWGPGKDSEWLMPKRVRPIHPKAFAYVVDEFLNILGVVGAEPGDMATLPQIGRVDGDLSKLKGFEPKERFLIYRNAGLSNDPRGESVLAAAYNYWFAKRLTYPDYLRFLKQFATPSIIGICGPDATDEPVRDNNGQVMIGPDEMPITVTAARKLMSVLASLTGNSALAVPYGTTFEVIKSEGDGKAFTIQDDLCNRAIHTAVNGTDALALPAKNDSQAAKGVGQDVFGLFVSEDKRAISAVLTGFARLLVRINGGEDEVPFAPQVTLSAVEREDRIARGDMYSRMQSAGLLHWSQIPAIMDEVGAPPVDPKVLKEEEEQRAERETLAAGALGKLKNPEDPAEKES